MVEAGKMRRAANFVFAVLAFTRLAALGSDAFAQTSAPSPVGAEAATADNAIS